MNNCVNCGAETDNVVLNNCGHVEYVCEDCCKALDNIHHGGDGYICVDNCEECCK